MPKKCTPGVYMIEGNKGVRIERRVNEVSRGYGECIGEVKKVYMISVMDKQIRLALERFLIELIKPSCNKVKR
jgi:hypothetical protein